MAPRRSATEATQCRHCESALVPHGDADAGNENPAKAGALHCNGCGCCFGPDGKVRPGHPFCRETSAEEIAEGYSGEEPSDGEASEAPPVATGDPDAPKSAEQPPTGDD